MIFNAVITEYNPFHNGHLYQLKKMREVSKYNIVIMSSNFVQRGEPAIFNKFERAKLAVLNGASLVLELPVVFSTQNAEIFAKGAMSIIKSLEIVDNLFFGSEDNLNILKNIMDKISKNFKEDDLKKYLNEGHSFLNAKNLSMGFLTDEEKDIYRRPNNILAMEYVKAKDFFNLDINLNSIKRINVGYKDLKSKENFASATLIRKLIKDNRDFSKFIPNNFENLNYNDLNNYYDIFRFLILREGINFNNYYDFEEGLQNRIFENLDAKNIYELIDRVSSKRHTRARISRLILEILLDTNMNLIKKALNTSYIRVLGMDTNGIEILRKIKNDKIIKFSDSYKKSSGILREILDKEVFATNLYNLGKKINEDFYKTPFILK